MGSRIFISYRREDSSGHAGRLYDRLDVRFGHDQVFMDVDKIRPGQDFIRAIEESVSASDAFVVVIGPEWLTAEDESGRRRLDDPHDFVCLEIKSALKRAVSVIPVLVRDAKMPQEEELPAEIASLARHQALELSDERWGYDVGRLIEVLDEVLGGGDPTEAILPVSRDRDSHTEEGRRSDGVPHAGSDEGDRTDAGPERHTVPWMALSLAVLGMALVFVAFFLPFRLTRAGVPITTFGAKWGALEPYGALAAAIVATILVVVGGRGARFGAGALIGVGAASMVTRLAIALAQDGLARPATYLFFAGAGLLVAAGIVARSSLRATGGHRRAGEGTVPYMYGYAALLIFGVGLRLANMALPLSESRSAGDQGTGQPASLLKRETILGVIVFIVLLVAFYLAISWLHSPPGTPLIAGFAFALALDTMLRVFIQLFPEVKLLMALTLFASIIVIIAAEPVRRRIARLERMAAGTVPPVSRRRAA